MKLTSLVSAYIEAFDVPYPAWVITANAPPLRAATLFLKSVSLIIILLPLVSIEIIKYFNKIKSNYKYYYLVKIMFKNNICIELNSFLDTGNKLVDPYTNKGIILVDINKIIGKINIRSPIYVPFKSLNNTGLIKCIKPQFIEINGKSYNNYLVGLAEEKFNIDGIDCLLNYKLMEELNA